MYSVRTVEEAQHSDWLGLKCRVVLTRSGYYKTQFRALFIWHDSNIVAPAKGLEGLAVHTTYAARQNSKPQKNFNKIEAIVYP